MLGINVAPNVAAPNLAFLRNCAGAFDGGDGREVSPT